MKLNEEKTDKDIQFVSGDVSFMPMLNYHPARGRNFTEMEIQSAANVAVVGNDIVLKLSPNQEILGREIKINGHKFRVIGVTKTRGSMMGQSMDKFVIVPITWALKYFYTDGKNADLMIALKAPSLEEMEHSKDETIGILRSMRNCKP